MAGLTFAACSPKLAPAGHYQDSPVAADGVPSEHVPTRREAARRRFAELLETVTAND